MFLEAKKKEKTVNIRKKYFLSFFLLFAILFQFVITLPAEASFSLEKRHQETKAKIKRIKWLETVESNKLYKNQRKLEQNETYLQSSKVRYTSAQMRLGRLESEYSTAQKEYSKSVASSAQRIRQVYKQQ